MSKVCRFLISEVKRDCKNCRESSKQSDKRATMYIAEANYAKYGLG